MHVTVTKLWTGLFALSATVLFICWCLFPGQLWARNILEYKDTLSTSAPGVAANHSLSFHLDVAIDPSSYIEIIPPDGFEIMATSTFDIRNVELLVNGVARAATSTASPGYDQVEITTGSPGRIRYTLAPNAGIPVDSNLVLKIGSHTSGANAFSESYSTSTGTTTVPADVPGIVNALQTGTHEVDVRIYDGVEVANAGFLVALVPQVGVGPVDTTETVPPYRFNGAPTSSVGGTTLSVEISLETDELAICKYSATSSTPYGSMTQTFSNTGFIFHSSVVSVTPNTTQIFYVRCLDDEGNFNTDDFIIQFVVNDRPSGTANDEGNVSGDGSGSGNDGTGDGGGSGGQTGESDGEAPESGGSSGGGGSGGGSGGGRGPDSGGTAGGGFESTDDVYPSGDGRVEISGYAYPRSRVTILVDGQQADVVTAGASGAYSVTLDAIARGVYTFGVFATDAAQTRSTTFSTSFTVTGARTTSLSNINLTPTVKVSPDPVSPGVAATISGYALPNATITIENERDKSTASRKTLTAASDSSGAWSVVLDTAGLTNGTYKARARAVQTGGLSSSFSGYTLYGVGQAADRVSTADLNTDGKVNLTDFSILLFWWGTSGGDSNPPADINRDSRVNLTDFSIMLFNWTG